jgi:glucokinase
LNYRRAYAAPLAYKNPTRIHRHPANREREMYLGIEIGGTKLQLGLGPGTGSLAGMWRALVDAAAAAEGIRRQIMAAIPELLAQSGIERSQVRGIGIGFGGPVDDTTRTVIKSHQIEGWEDFPLADWIADRLGWPAVLGNDADVAGLAEARFGAGKGLTPIFYITIGSGIGGGLIVAGDIYRGVGKGAAEIGHLRVEGDAAILEEVASGWGIERQALAAFGEARTVPAIVRAAMAGDGTATTILHRSWSALAEAICHVIPLLCPRRIILGGGVSLIGEEFFFGPLRRMVAERVFKPFADCYDIVPAILGEEVVVHGALALARRRLGGISP